MQVILSAYAADRRQALLDHLADTYSYRLSIAVDTLIEECLDSLPYLPRQWSEVDTKNFGRIRKVTLEGLTLIFYRIQGDQIEILDILDARSDWH